MNRSKTRRGAPPLIKPWMPRKPYIPKLNTIPEGEEEILPLWAQRTYARRILPPEELFNDPTTLRIRTPRNHNNNLYVSPHNNSSYLNVSPNSPSGGTRKRRAKKRKTRGRTRR